MKKNKIVFWVSTSIVGGMMAFSGFNYFSSPDMMAAFTHLGFPDYFRMELGVAKILGGFALLLPLVPKNIKEWAYAGFGITLISAIIAHMAMGDPISMAVAPAVFLGLLAVSYIFYKKNHGVK
ncbi:DoxX family protein [Sediminicola luteus]|uniref:DoxX-like family protein n=1 Tax=Sediminicola luteus TaxID=319238 RepID=A0A2A4GFV4_9FLAO|nr:DoxX family protein [Sediminicola luteus]PCE66612.1 DoxX-like family protein [Sediminicola luteus]